MKRKIYVIYEDCHGNIGYWTTKRKAIKEAIRILKETGIEATKETIEEGEEGIYIMEVFLNQNW